MPDQLLPLEAAREARAYRYKALRAVKSITKTNSLKFCHSRPLNGRVSLREKNDTHYFAGFMHCNRVWICPNCATKINWVRSLEVEDALNRHKANGGTALFLTFTARHFPGEKLKPLFEGFRKAKGFFLGHRSWATWKRLNGVVGYIQSLEITPGGTTGSPHVHMHMILLLNRSTFLSADELGHAVVDLGTYWANAVSKNMSPDHAPEITRGVHIEQVDLNDVEKLAHYSNKTVASTTASELTRTDSKNKNSNYWDIAIKASRGDKQAYAMWHEYEEAVFNVEKTGFSRGLRITLGMSKKDKTNEEIMDEEVDGNEVMAFSKTNSDIIAKMAECLKAKLLVYSEDNGPNGVKFFISRIRHSMMLKMPGNKDELAERWLDVNRYDLRYDVERICQCQECSESFIVGDESD
jgi:hypothetical protein